MASNSARRQLADLSRDELGIVLKFVSVEDIARAASTCRLLKDAARIATDARAAASAVPLPPLKQGEPKLRALRWCEAMAKVAPRTIAAGTGHSLCVTPRDGMLCSWGQNNDGVLGHGFGEPWERPPHKLDFAPSTLSNGNVAACHTVFVDADGAVWSWGMNTTGQLGHGDQESRCRPTRIASLGTRILQVACAIDHMVMLTAAGGVLAVGIGAHAQLGVGGTDEEVEVILAGDLILEDDDSRLQPIAVPGFGDRRVVEVSAGMNHNVAVCELGGVWTWGDAKLMNAGVHDGNDFVAQRVAALVSVRIRQACCGESCALAVTTDGALYAWGGNDRGELGVGTQGGDGSV